MLFWITASHTSTIAAIQPASTIRSGAARASRRAPPSPAAIAMRMYVGVSEAADRQGLVAAAQPGAEDLDHVQRRSRLPGLPVAAIPASPSATRQTLPGGQGGEQRHERSRPHESERPPRVRTLSRTPDERSARARPPPPAPMRRNPTPSAETPAASTSANGMPRAAEPRSQPHGATTSTPSVRIIGSERDLLDRTDQLVAVDERGQR